MLFPQKDFEKSIYKAHSLAELTHVLESMLGCGYGVSPDRVLCYVRQRTLPQQGLTIRLCAETETQPMAFSIYGEGIDALFSLQEGTYLKGAIKGREAALVKFWFERAQEKLRTALLTCPAV